MPSSGYTNRPHPSTWLPLFDRALDNEIGIAFTISGVTREYFRNTLYEAKKSSGDPRYDDLIIFMPVAPCDQEMWICKRAVELDQ
jgi:hypothetical protein